MKNILIVKTGAAGDVLRTTFVLSTVSKKYKVYWLTDQLCIDLINPNLAVVTSRIEDLIDIEFEIIYSLEEDRSLLNQVQQLNYNNIVGCAIANGNITYSASNEKWFDISLVSKYGIDKADELKYSNSLTFQQMISGVFDIPFNGESYNELYHNKIISKQKSIAIAPTAGNKWPNKNWAYYDKLKVELEKLGFTVDYLTTRASIKEHISDIAVYKLIICGDSLPMHIATALKIPSIVMFTCTSPVEIYDYNLINKVISEKLDKFYYKRNFDIECVEAISLETVIEKFNSLRHNFFNT